MYFCKLVVPDKYKIKQVSRLTGHGFWTNKINIGVEVTKEKEAPDYFYYCGDSAPCGKYMKGKTEGDVILYHYSREGK